jgi:cytochrome b561
MYNKRYYPLSIFFHWLVFLLVAGALAVIELKGQFVKGSEPRELCKTIHGLLGQLIFVAMVLRLGIRMIYGAPTQPGTISLFRVLDKAMHWLLYFLLLTLPIMGLVFLQAGGKDVHFFSWTLPQMINPDPSLKKTFKELHEWLGNTIYFLVGVHALAALWHHYILKNDTLRRMLNKSDLETK